MMQHVLRLARAHGLTDVVATVQFLASVVRNFFGDGSDLGIDLSYVTEAWAPEADLTFADPTPESEGADADPLPLNRRIANAERRAVAEAPLDY